MTDALPQDQTPAFLMLPQPELRGNVTMSRALAESGHGLSLNESRVIWLALSTIDPRSNLYTQGRDFKVRVTAADFAGLADLQPDRHGYTPSAAYEGLKSACDRLFERKAMWIEGNKKIKVRWVNKSVYHEKEAWAELHFSVDLWPHISMLTRQFVRFRLEFARGLRSIYSTNLLRLLMTQKDTGFKAITLADYRLAMDVPETYRYADIKRYAILPAVAELNEKADLSIDWTEIKRGRSVYSLRFNFKINARQDPQSPLDFGDDELAIFNADMPAPPTITTPVTAPKKLPKAKAGKARSRSGPSPITTIIDG